MSATDKPDAPNQLVLLQVNGELLDRASESGTNLSSVLEQSLVKAIRVRQGENWLAKNREAICAYNEYIEAHGVFSDGLRGF